MPYLIQKSDHDLQAMLRRVAAEELDAAVDRLSTSPVAAEDVHDVRKRVKKLRGLLRLLRFGLPVFADENAALRAAAAHLSAQRDADVRVATFDKVAGPQAQAGAVRALLGAKETGATENGGSADPVPPARDALLRIRARVPTWTLEGRDRDVLQQGLAQTRRHARRAMAVAAAAPSAHALHEWRKRIKDGWYQARLLTPIHPENVKPVADQAAGLGEDLGEHHDLAVLADHLAALPESALPVDLRAEVLARIRAAQDVLEARSFAAGASLLAEKPKAMARHWAGWWQDWRG